MMNKFLLIGLLLLPFMTIAEQKATDKKQVDKKPVNIKDSAVVNLESTITGNSEQPKVLYIVPWKAPDGPESLRQGFQRDLDELFQPVERGDFLRQLKVRQKPRRTQSERK